MTNEELADYLESYNAWRRGSDEIPHPHPEHLGEALELAVAILRGEADE